MSKARKRIVYPGALYDYLNQNQDNLKVYGGKKQIVETMQERWPDVIKTNWDGYAAIYAVLGRDQTRSRTHTKRRDSQEAISVKVKTNTKEEAERGKHIYHINFEDGDRQTVMTSNLPQALAKISPECQEEITSIVRK